MTRALLFLALFGGALVATGLEATAASPGADSVLADPRFQRALPPAGLSRGGGGGGGSGGGGSGGGAGFGGGGGGGGGIPLEGDGSGSQADARTNPPPPTPREPLPEPPRRDPPDLERVGNFVLWAVLIVVGAVAALLIYRWVRRGGLANLFAFLQLFKRFGTRRKKKGVDEPAATESVKAAKPADLGPPLPVPNADRPLTEWERLAQAGDYAAAVHAILRYAVGLLRTRFGIATSSELTSREILGAARRQRAAADPMAIIVAAVEFIHFGGRNASVADYERCAASLRELEEREATP